MSIVPVETVGMNQSRTLQLAKQGVLLHLSTILGPLSVMHKPQQRFKASRLFINEYGLNLVFLLMLQVVILQSFKSNLVIAEMLAVFTLVGMSVVQMFVDNFRKNIHVFHSKRHETGLSVRVESSDKWAFFNHYALPVGRKYGIALRAELHKQAKDHKIILYCYAQNMDVALHYVKEHSDGVITGTKRPLVVWDYREDQTATGIFKQKKKMDLFGLHSVRNSGSLPLGK
jgi:hypothetical protein